MNKSIFTDEFRSKLLRDIEDSKKDLEERKKFIGAPLPYEMMIKKIEDENKH